MHEYQPRISLVVLANISRLQIHPSLKVILTRLSGARLATAMDVFSRRSNVNCTVSRINQHRTPIKQYNGTIRSAKFNRLNWTTEIISVLVHIRQLFEVEHLGVSLPLEGN